MCKFHPAFQFAFTTIKYKKNMKKTRYNLGQIILFSRINGPDIQALQT